MATQAAAQGPDMAGSLIASLGQIIKPAGSNGQASQQDVVAILLKNMPQLTEYAKQGKLNETQMNQLRVLTHHAQQQRAAKIAAQNTQPNAQQGQNPQNPAAATSSVPAPSPSKANAIPASQARALHAPTQQPAPPMGPPPPAGIKRKSPGDDLPISANHNQGYGISATLNTTNPGPQAWPNSSAPARPTLSGGLPAGRMSGTPAQLERVPEDLSMYGLGEGRVGQRKMTPADQSMRRTIQDLVSGIDPNVKIEPEVEDLLLDIADEFIDSVTNFGCRLAKHRGGDTLEVRDLQLHLERNHNIRIPGFASDETRISISQSATAASAPAPPAKKAAQGTHMTLRSARLAAVQQAKKEAKLM